MVVIDGKYEELTDISQVQFEDIYHIILLHLEYGEQLYLRFCLPSSPSSYLKLTYCRMASFPWFCNFGASCLLYGHEKLM